MQLRDVDDETAGVVAGVQVAVSEQRERKIQSQGLIKMKLS